MNQVMFTQPAEAPALSEPEWHSLELAVDRLLAVADPLKVILFGSRARGQARAGSDMDLLIVLPMREGLDDLWDRMLDAVHTLRPHVDLVVTTAEEFGWRSQVSFFVQYYAARDGHTLYERS